MLVWIGWFTPQHKRCLFNTDSVINCKQSDGGSVNTLLHTLTHTHTHTCTRAVLSFIPLIKPHLPAWDFVWGQQRFLSLLLVEVFQAEFPHMLAAKKSCWRWCNNLEPCGAHLWFQPSLRLCSAAEISLLVYTLAEMNSFSTKSGFFFFFFISLRQSWLWKSPFSCHRFTLGTRSAWAPLRVLSFLSFWYSLTRGTQTNWGGRHDYTSLTEVTWLQLPVSS